MGDLITFHGMLARFHGERLKLTVVCEKDTMFNDAISYSHFSNTENSSTTCERFKSFYHQTTYKYVFKSTSIHS